MATVKEETKLSLRCRLAERELIDRAAGMMGKSRTEFMLESSRREAERVLLDQRHFQLSEEKMTEFLSKLDAPVDHTKLKALLTSKAPWER